MHNLFLVGYMGAGKSTVGRLVAERSGRAFVDLDAEIARAAGQSVSAIFDSEGETGFRARERAALAEVCRCPGVVVATGGGVVLEPDNVRRMRRSGPVVLLHASPETMWRRVEPSDRPLAADRDAFMRRYRDREPYYAVFPLRVSTEDDGSSLAADSIVARFYGPSATVGVELGDRRYLVELVPHALASLGERMAESLSPGPCLLVTNPTVQKLWGEVARDSLERAGWQPVTVTVPDAEEAKSLKEAERLYDAAIEARLERRHPVVALGGGVVGDLAGFVAATYQRGVPLVQVPTTLLAQLDSSVGGKVALNRPRGKNMVGAFHQPARVVADPLTLHTLSDREYRAGLAELLKMAVLFDAALFERLAVGALEIRERALGGLVPAIARSCELKARVVEADETERGQRALLNLGHTAGHALETVTGYRRFRHGEAVAIGMGVAGELAVRLGSLDRAVHERIMAWLADQGLPVSLTGFSARALLEAMRADKKVEAGSLRWVIPTGLGSAEIRRDVDEALVVAAMRARGAAH